MPHENERSRTATAADTDGSLPYQSLLAYAREVILILGPDATVQYATPACESVLGVGPEQIVGCDLFDRVHPDDRPRLAAALVQLKSRATGSARVTYRCHHQSGGWRTLEAELWNTVTSGERDGRVVVSTRDVTERAQLTEQLGRAQHMAVVGQAVSAVAHDFRNMLHIITASTSLARSAVQSGASPREDLDAIDEAASRATQLVQQLRATNGERRTEPQDLDLASVVRGLEPLLRRMVDPRITIVTTVAARLEPVRAERGPMEQVLVNLVVNARDAMPDGGTLTIEVANVEPSRADVAREHALVPQMRPGAWVRLRVRDTGVGMDAATRARAFEPFFTTKADGTGMGLGLATARAVVERHRGRIAIASTPGHGTTVEVHLPSALQDLDAMDQPTRAQWG